MADLMGQTDMSDDSAEIWPPVLGYEEFYSVSSRGRVLSFHKKRTRFLSPALDRYGYLCVRLYRGAGSSHRPVHQLVCEAFHGPRPPGMVVRHLDGDQLNLAPSNLKWGTPAENSQDRSQHGRDPNATKTHCPAGHPYEGGNVLVDENGWRKCRTCVRERFNRYREEHREEMNAQQRESQRRKRDNQTPEEHAAERAQRRVYEAELRERHRQEANAERAAQGLPPLVRNQEKTHCPAGHPYDEENTYVVPKTGVRQCKICRVETMKRYFERQKQKKRDDAA